MATCVILPSSSQSASSSKPWVVVANRLTSVRTLRPPTIRRQATISCWCTSSPAHRRCSAFITLSSPKRGGRRDALTNLHSLLRAPGAANLAAGDAVATIRSTPRASDQTHPRIRNTKAATTSLPAVGTLAVSSIEVREAHGNSSRPSPREERGEGEEEGKEDLLRLDVGGLDDRPPLLDFGLLQRD